MAVTQKPPRPNLWRLQARGHTRGAQTRRVVPGHPQDPGTGLSSALGRQRRRVRQRRRRCQDLSPLCLEFSSHPGDLHSSGPRHRPSSHETPWRLPGPRDVQGPQHRQHRQHRQQSLRWACLGGDPGLWRTLGLRVRLRVGRPRRRERRRRSQGTAEQLAKMWAASADLGVGDPRRDPADPSGTLGAGTALAWATREQDRDEGPRASWTWGFGSAIYTGEDRTARGTKSENG